MKLYEDLQIPKDATPAQIKSAHRRLCKKYHPDKTGGQSAGLFHRIQDAFDILSDPDKRRQYDESGDQPIGFTQIEKDCVEAIKGCIDGTPEGTDYVAEVKSFFRGRKRDAQSERHMILTNLAKTTKAKNLIVRKGKATPGARNPFYEALCAKETLLESQAQAKLDEIAAIDARIAYLDGWETRRERHPGEEFGEHGISVRGFSISFT
jgi:curved DNA-binding protein CbpA